jgi:HEAT repeat protein
MSIPLAAQDFQSAENLYKKAYDWEQKFYQAARVDPAKAAEPLNKAIEYYGKSVDRAQQKKDVEYQIKAAFAQARCYELLDPISEDAAMNAYKAVGGLRGDLSAFKDKKLAEMTWYVDRADELGKRAGVHMYLNRFAQVCYNWRNGQATPKMLEEEKTKAWDLIKGKGPGACYGLIQGLDVREGGKEEQVVTFIADKLKYVIDQPNIVLLIEKLRSKEHRAGAAVAMREVMLQFNRAKEFDDAANQAEFDWGFIGDGQSPEHSTGVNKLKNELKGTAIDEMRSKAKAMRFSMPETLDAPEVIKALVSVIEDVGIEETARTEALMVLTSFDNLGESLVNTIITALGDTNQRVRAAAANVAGKVNTTRFEDKHKIVDKLIELVQYEPEIDTELIELVNHVEQGIHPDLRKLLSALADPKIQNDAAAKQAASKAIDDKKAELLKGAWAKRANTAIVRQQCAMSLGNIALIKSIPSLIEALGDDQKIVRAAAYEALLKIIEPLKEVREIKMPFDPDAPRNAEMKAKELEKFAQRIKGLPPEQQGNTEAAKAALEQKTPRDEDIKRWNDWWEQTRGIEVLLTRWDIAMRKWTYYHPNELYDLDGFNRKMLAKARFSPNPAKEVERAKAVSEKFHYLKNLLLQDVVDMTVRAPSEAVAKDTIKHLFAFLHGKIQGRDDPYLAVQMFVSNCLAMVAHANKDEATKKEISDIVQGFKESPPEIKTGCAYALGFVPREWIGMDETNAAERALQDGDWRVRLAACFALGKIGNPRSAKHLPPRMRFDSEKELIVQKQGARAIGRIAFEHKSVFQEVEFVKELAIPIYDEIDDPATQANQKKDPKPEVREEVCFAIGEGAHSNAVPFLIRARRDVDERVKFAAAWAYQQIAKNEAPNKIGDMLWEIYSNKDTKFSDREGCVLGIGDVKDSSKVKILCEKLVGSGEQPWRVWEPHERVRAGIGEALGLMGVRTIEVRDALLKALEDSAEEVRRSSFKSLDTLCDGELSKIKLDVNVEGKGPMNTSFTGNLPPASTAEFLKQFKTYLEGAGKDKFKPGE